MEGLEREIAIESVIDGEISVNLNASVNKFRG
jgi:hypothetical protein